MLTYLAVWMHQTISVILKSVHPSSLNHLHDMVLLKQSASHISIFYPLLSTDGYYDDASLLIYSMMNNKEGSNDLRKKIEHYSYGLRDFLWQSQGYNVFYGIDQSRSEKVAIRVVDLRRHPTVKDALSAQIEIIKRLKHPNILHTLDVFSTVNNCYIITELYPDGSLQHRLAQQGRFDETEALNIFKQIVDGWLYLLKEKVIHANLAPAHILLDHNKVTISGFGCSRREGKAPKSRASFSQYQSPESASEDLTSFKGDIWSLGTILYVLLHGDFPWKCSDKNEYLQVAGRTPLDILPGLSNNVVDFLRRTLTPVKERMSERAFKQHPLIVGISLGVSGLVIQEESVKESPLKKPHHTPHIIKQVQKQITAHFNWMRFLFRLLQRVRPLSEENESTKVLKFIIARQVLVQYNEIKTALVEGENRLQLSHWDEYITNIDRMSNFRENIHKNQARNDNALYTYRTILSGLSINPPHLLKNLLNERFILSEYNCMVAIRAILEQINRIWPIITRDYPPSKSHEGCEPFKYRQLLMVTDFLASYYQLNCILIEDFQRIDYFEKMSKLDIILEFQPVDLDASHIYELHQKLLQLEIIKQ